MCTWCFYYVYNFYNYLSQPSYVTWPLACLLVNASLSFLTRHKLKRKGCATAEWLIVSVEPWLYQ